MDGGATAKKAEAKPKKAEPKAKKAEPKKEESKPKADAPVDGPRAVITFVLTKCDGKVSALVGKEPYDKWGIPTGRNDGDLLKSAEKNFKEKTGKDYPKVADKEEHKFRDVAVHLVYTDECVDTKLGKADKERGMKELKHVAVDDLYKLVDKPDAKEPLRPVFISMLVDLKKPIQDFAKKHK